MVELSFSSSYFLYIVFHMPIPNPKKIVSDFKLHNFINKVNS